MSKIEVLRGPRLEDPPQQYLRDSRDMSQPLLRTTRTDVRKSKEAALKSLESSHQNSPHSKEDVSTAMGRQGPERGRRSPVVIQAYNSTDDQSPRPLGAPNVRADSDRFLIKEQNQQEANSQDVVHIVSTKELHSRHESRQRGRISPRSLHRLNQPSPAASRGR